MLSHLQPHHHIMGVISVLSQCVAERTPAHVNPQSLKLMAMYCCPEGPPSCHLTLNSKKRLSVLRDQSFSVSEYACVCPQVFFEVKLQVRAED